MEELMKADTTLLAKIFNAPVSYQVPVFQRPYVWKEDTNWKPLWEDIEYVLARMARPGKVRPHFLGATVLEWVPGSTGSIATRLVIDGQQRLTTLQVIFMVLRDLARSNGIEKYAARFRGLIEVSEEYIEAPDDLYKLLPTNADRPAFRLINGAGSLAALANLLKDEPFLGDHALVAVYRYFHGRFSRWIEGDFDEPSESGDALGMSLEKRFEQLWALVNTHLLLVVIDVEPDEESQVIFETMNHLGTPLLPGDLIKNYLFRRLDLDEPALLHINERYWSRFDASFWRDLHGRQPRVRLDIFLTFYLAMMTRTDVRATHLFAEFKAFAEGTGLADDVPRLTSEEHIRSIARYARIYTAFEDPGNHPRLATFMRRMEAFETQTVMPFLLRAYGELMPYNRTEFDAVLDVVESYLMRRMIIRARNAGYNRLFIDVMRALEKQGNFNAEATRAYLSKSNADTTRWPSDDEIWKAVAERPIYTDLARKRLRPILEAIDGSISNRMTEALPLPEDLTIEHVLPQKWQDHWPFPAETLASLEATLAAENKRKTLLHTIGNLTLVTQRFNSSLSNRGWVVKKDEIWNTSKLNINTYFTSPRISMWDEQAIQTRSRTLFERIVDIWPAGIPVRDGSES